MSRSHSALPTPPAQRLDAAPDCTGRRLSEKVPLPGAAHLVMSLSVTPQFWATLCITGSLRTSW